MPVRVAARPVRKNRDPRGAAKIFSRKVYNRGKTCIELRSSHNAAAKQTSKANAAEVKKIN